MVQNLLQISQITADDLGKLIEEKINQAIGKLNLKQSDDDKQFYTREETAKMLNISLTSLYNWAKQGILIPQKIGHRVYYSKSEVYSKLQINF